MKLYTKLIRTAIIFFIFLSFNEVNAEFVDIQPVRKSSERGSTLNDIDSHLPAGHIYADADKITFGHESTHAVNARLRNSFHKPNGYYMIKNKGFVIGNPDITLRQVAEAVPQDKRGGIYNLYLVQSLQWWNDTPFYVIDELTGYTNGCIVGLEYDNEFRTLDSYVRCLEMWEYVKVAQEQSRRSNFAEQKELDRFLDWYYNNRILWIAKEIKARNWNMEGKMKGKPFITWRPVYKILHGR